MCSTPRIFIIITYTAAARQPPAAMQWGCFHAGENIPAHCLRLFDQGWRDFPSDGGKKKLIFPLETWIKLPQKDQQKGSCILRIFTMLMNMLNSKNWLQKYKKWSKAASESCQVKMRISSNFPMVNLFLQFDKFWF